MREIKRKECGGTSVRKRRDRMMFVSSLRSSELL